jgi:hypothetical protein
MNRFLNACLLLHCTDHNHETLKRHLFLYLQFQFLFMQCRQLDVKMGIYDSLKPVQPSIYCKEVTSYGKGGHKETQIV